MPTISQIEELGDDIVMVELENGLVLTTRIDHVNAEERQVSLKDPMIFQIGPPQQPGGQPVVHGQALGGPFRDPAKPSTPLDIDRILFIHHPIEALKKAWMKNTSGIEIADASILHTGR